MNELANMIKALIERGFDLHDIAGCVGLPKRELKNLLEGKGIDVEYRVKARLQFLYHKKNLKKCR